MGENSSYNKIDKPKIKQAWNGYCPESWLRGKTVRMRLNDWDFYESEETGLQIAPINGFQAVILNFRGCGSFRATPAYGDEIEQGQMLSPQNSDDPPFNNPVTVFKGSEEIETYINAIKPTKAIASTPANRDDNEQSHLERFWEDITGGYTFQTLEDRFYTQTNYLMNYLCLCVGNQAYRIVECEIYYYDKEKHPDPYVHRREQQLTAGKWYFNDMGLDITFGSREKGIYASILLSGIRNLKTNRYTSGTANVVREIFDNLGAVIQDGNGICLREINKGAFEEIEPTTTTRIGLTRKEEDQQNFIKKNYRYLVELVPEHKFSGKEELVRKLLKSQTIIKSEAKDILGYNLTPESDSK